MKIRLNRGFTLIELLIVIAIIGLLTGILLRAVVRARESARITQCASNLRQIGFGLIMYSNENDETFPTGSTHATSPAMEDFNRLYPVYVSERKVFKCPSDSLFVTVPNNADIQAGVPFTKNQCSYGYDNTHGPGDGSGVAIAGDRPANTDGNEPDPGKNSPNHGGRVNPYNTADEEGKGQNVLYIDGHVEWFTTSNAGYWPASGTRDDIYEGTGSGTDTIIKQDGGA
jgi:prepilin-type N-terminal cleavage/methylation domain-containing protein/prepilin-type processing-associated H-X9-DG protein